MRLWLAPSAFAPHRGGVEELTLKIAQHLQAAGDDVTVVTNRHPKALPSRDEVEGVPVRRVAFTAPGRRPDRAARHFLAACSVQAALTDIGPVPDVIHVVCPSTQLPPIARWARTRAVPLIITSQGETAMDAGRIYQRSAWMRQNLRSAAADSAALTSCSTWTAAAAAEVAPGFARSTVVLNGVDPNDWCDLPAVPDEPVVAAWGRHVPQKGFDLLLDAWPLVLAEIPTAALRLGGDGPETAALRARAGAGVQFVGDLDREGVRDLLRSARIAVVPSRIEPFGIVALEALAAGRGLVYSAGTGLAEAAGACGRAVDPRDPVALAAAAVAELRAPTPAVVAREQAASLSWDQLAVHYRSLYASVFGITADA